MNTDVLHNARRAFQRATVTADQQDALRTSGRLLTRYAAALPDTPAALHVRQQLTECAERYLARCRRAQQKNR